MSTKKLKFMKLRDGYLIVTAGSAPSVIAALRQVEQEGTPITDVAVHSVLRQKGFASNRKLASNILSAIQQGKSQPLERFGVISYKFHPKSSAFHTDGPLYSLKLEAVELTRADPPLPFDDEPPPRRRRSQLGIAGHGRNR